MQAVWETLGAPRSRAAGKSDIFNNYCKPWRLFNLCGEQLTSTSPHDRPVCSWAVVWLGAHAKRWGALPLSFTRSHQVGLAVSHAGAQPLPEADGSALGAAGQFWVLGRAQVTGRGNEGCHKML